MGQYISKIRRQTGDIFKLNIDCFEALFDYLSLHDLLSLSETCNRLHQLIKYYFHLNNVRGFDMREIPISFRRNVDYAYSFVPEIWISPGIMETFPKIQSKFRLEEILLTDLTSKDMEKFINHTKILNKIKMLHMHRIDSDEKFHDLFSLCPNLNILKLKKCCIKSDWMNQRYPSLKYLEFCSIIDSSDSKLPIFLECNPNIRQLRIEFELFWKNRHSFMEANIKLDELIIFEEDLFENMEGLNSFYRFLNELYVRDFYKKLHLEYIYLPDTDNHDQLVTLNGLKKLSVHCHVKRIFFSNLSNLEELNFATYYFYNSNDDDDFAYLTDDLSNIKRINFKKAHIDHMLPFIRHSVKLQKIYVGSLFGGTHYNQHTHVIDLGALNRKRAQLPNARKITLYVEEHIYLATKWSMKGNNFGLIRMKRNS